MKALRSNFEPGTTRWAVRRSQWRAMGISEEDLEKPKIAVVNSSSSLSVCYQHLDGVSDRVQQAVREAGGLPFEIHTIAPSDFVTSAGREGRYVLPSRDLLVNDIEVAVEGAVLDGMICLASCDKTTPGQLMAAGRLNVPTIVVIGGYQAGGICGGQSVDIDDVYESVGSVVAGSMTVEELRDLADCAIVGPGVCAGLGTANTMHIACEALGMALPGSAPVRAGSPRMNELAEEAGRRIVQMVVDDVRPREIITPEAIDNAVMATLAVSGSVNAARHLQAIAVEAGLDTDVYGLIEKHDGDIPQLCIVRPNGSHTIDQLEHAGGTRALLYQLRDRLHLDVPTVSGQSLRTLCEDASVGDTDIIRPIDRPYSERPGLILVRGSLAPGGALVKLAAVPKDRMYFRGPARVYASETAAIDALDGRIKAGDVVVLRGLGPMGGPGTVFAASFVAALNGAGLASEVAVVTDGELSGLNRGLTVGQVMPEAAEGGPLALVEEDDLITIDLENGAGVELHVERGELDRRRGRWTAPIAPRERSWLSQYRQLVRPLSQGAVLGPVPDTEG